MKPAAERLAELTAAIRAAEQHQKEHDQTLNRYHANYLIALLLCWEAELITRKRGKTPAAYQAETAELITAAFDAGAAYQAQIDELGIYADDYHECLDKTIKSLMQK